MFRRISGALVVLLLILVVDLSASTRVRTLALLTNASSTVSSSKLQPGTGPWSLHAFGTTSTGAGAAVVVIEVSNIENPAIDADWITAGTITLTLAATGASDGFSSAASWRNVRARVSSISGTGAKVSVVLGVEAAQ